MEVKNIYRRYEQHYQRNYRRKPVIGKVKGLFRRPRKPTLKEKISLSLSLLESTSRKLQSLSERLKRRDQKFFEKCIDAEVSGDHTRAIIYANECAELRKFARLTISSQLALEQANLRLQTIDKLGDVLASITPIVKIVEETKGRLVNTIPSVAGKLNEINSLLKSSMVEIPSTDSSSIISDNSSEVAQVLQEANLSAEEKIRERFPVFPKLFEIPRENKVRIPVALSAGGGTVEIEDKNSLTQQVYEYIKAFPGQFSVSRCADFLAISPKAVNEVLIKLEEEGRITP